MSRLSWPALAVGCTTLLGLAATGDALADGRPPVVECGVVSSDVVKDGERARSAAKSCFQNALAADPSFAATLLPQQVTDGPKGTTVCFRAQADTPPHDAAARKLLRCMLDKLKPEPASPTRPMPPPPTTSPTSPTQAPLYVGDEALGKRIADAELALAKDERRYRPTDPALLPSLRSLADLLEQSSDFAGAARIRRRVLEIDEKVHGARSTEAAKDHERVADDHQNAGALPEARVEYARAVAIYDALGLKKDLRAPLAALAENARRRHDLPGAREYYGRAIALAEAARESAAFDRMKLGEACFRASEYECAEAAFASARAESAKGGAHPDERVQRLAFAHLALLYETTLDHARADEMLALAEPLVRAATDPPEAAQPSAPRALAGGSGTTVVVAITFTHEKKSVYYGLSEVLLDLANVRRARGDYGAAEEYFTRAALVESRVGFADMAASDQGDLAVLYFDTGRYDEAKDLLQSTLESFEQMRGPSDPDTAKLMGNLASVYDELGQPRLAQPLRERSLAVLEKDLGPDHWVIATSLYNLATTYRELGDLARAEATDRRALDIRTRVLGPEHLDVAQSLMHLGLLRARAGRFADAVDRMSESGAITEKNLSTLLASGSDEQKARLLGSLWRQTEVVVSLNVRNAASDPAAARLALTTILQRKARALDAMSGRIAALRARASSDDRALLDKLQATRAALAVLVLQGPGGRTPAAYAAETATLQRSASELEAQASARAGLSGAEAPPALDDVQRVLPADAALVELLAYHPFNATGDAALPKWASARYVAYVLRSKGDPVPVDLGATAEVDALVQSFRTALVNPKDAEAARAAGRALDERVGRPIRALLQDARRVVLAPDGNLSLVPFGALVDETGHYLIERFSFTYVSSGRDLVRFGASAPTPSPPLVVANPDFGPFAAPSTDARGFARARFPALPGTADEATAVSHALVDATVYTGGKATKSTLMTARAPRILHVATHGFFLADRSAPSAGATPDRGLALDTGESGKEKPRIANPLLRSGLAFAHANEHSTKEDDGILTALEASTLDLRGTKLVVLSACETGIGEVQNGNGVLGLRRALVLSGAESQVMSLWKVDDSATRDLMVAYYDGLVRRGGGRAEALRAAQLAMLGAGAAHSHPYFWASFIPSGDFHALDGRDAPLAGGGSTDPLRVAPKQAGCGCRFVGTPADIGGLGLGIGVVALALARRARRRDGSRPHEHARSHAARACRKPERRLATDARGALRRRARALYVTVGEDRHA